MLILPILLFASIGFSGWVNTSGWNLTENQFLNPTLNDSDHDGYPDYASGTNPDIGGDCWNADVSVNDDWTFGSYSNTTKIVNINNATIDWRGDATTAFITPHFQLNESRKQLIEFMFQYGGGTLYMSAFISDNSSGDYCRDFNEISIMENSATENINFYPVFAINSSTNMTITNLTGGWKKFSGWGEFASLQYNGNISAFRLFFWEKDEGLNWNLTNFSAMDYYYSQSQVWVAEQCQGWECPSIAKSLVGMSPIILGLAFLVVLVGLAMAKGYDMEGMVSLFAIALIALIFITILAGVLS